MLHTPFSLTVKSVQFFLLSPRPGITTLLELSGDWYRSISREKFSPHGYHLHTRIVHLAFSIKELVTLDPIVIRPGIINKAKVELQRSMNRPWVFPP
jgi:hypothetical protein